MNVRNLFNIARRFQPFMFATKTNSGPLAGAGLVCSRSLRFQSHKGGYGLLLPAGAGSYAFIFNLFKTEQEDPKDKLIMTIKRSILCINRAEYKKAEQLLHIALRMAQEMQHKEGVTYVYDVMANLALEQEQYRKAEKLFVEVMQRLLAAGYAEHSRQILHISSKMAHMAELQGELEKATQGFKWTLTKISKALRESPEDKELSELLGLTKNWFGQLLLKQKNFSEAHKLFTEAYDSCVEAYGAVNEAAIDILNNISVALVELEKYVEAREVLENAINHAKKLGDAALESSLKTNLGLVYLRLGMLAQAKNECKEAWRGGKEQKDDDTIQQAEFCLNEIRAAMNSN